MPQAVNSRLTGCSSSRVVKSHVSSGEHPITASGTPPTRCRNEKHYPESSPVTEGRMTERHLEELAAATDALNTAPRRRYEVLSAALAARPPSTSLQRCHHPGRTAVRHNKGDYIVNLTKGGGGEDSSCRETPARVQE